MPRSLWLSLAGGLGLLAMSLPSSAQGQETLTNETVVRLWRSGMPESFILDQIRKQPGDYSLSGLDLQSLKDARVSEALIDAMYAKRVQQNQVPRGADTYATTIPVSNPASARSTAAASVTPALNVTSRPVAVQQEQPPPAELGTALFFKKGANWIEISPEIMTWQNPGTAKKVTGTVSRVSTMGIMGKPVKASLAGEFSHNMISSQQDIIIDVPPNAPLHDFVMVPLRVEKGFRTAEVGGNRNHASHQSVRFGLEKTQTPNQYKVIFSDEMAPGEYGVYNVVTVFGRNHQSAKVYTFSLQ